MIELDMLLALVNRADKLHTVAVKLFELISKNIVKNIAIPTSALLEYELVLRSRGYREDDIRFDIEAFRNIENVAEIPLTSTVIVEASRLRSKYRLTYFDSLHAASALLFDKEIVSVDRCYCKIVELRAKDPREFVARYT